MRKNSPLLFAASLLLLGSCGQADTHVIVQQPDVDFVDNLRLIDNDAKKVFEPFFETDSTLFYVIPKETDLSHILCKSPDARDSIIYGGGSFVVNTFLPPVDFSNFVKPNYYFSYREGLRKKIVIFDLPIIILDTPNRVPIDSKEIRVEGCKLSLINVNGEIVDIGTAGIKGRGQSTWKQSKKPYNVKLDKKKSILGMKKSKHWLLLSNPYYDRTQLHNDVAFQIARTTDFPWVQSGEYVELIMNGEHKGLYYFCEKIRIEEGKIDIAEISPADTVGDPLTGGYLVESDIWAKEENNFCTDYFNVTGKGTCWPIIWNFSKPEGVIPNVQYDYFKNVINILESQLANDSILLKGTYREKLDIGTAVDWWIVENLCLNEEASRTKNMILYKDRDSSPSGGKVCVGPPWDLDAWTFGLTGTQKIYAGENTWIYKQLMKDPVFVNYLKSKWHKYKSKMEEIPLYIERRFNQIHRSALRNEVMWPDWHPYNHYPEMSYEQLIDEMTESYRVQLKWMDGYIGGISN